MTWRYSCTAGGIEDIWIVLHQWICYRVIRCLCWTDALIEKKKVFLYFNHFVCKSFYSTKPDKYGIDGEPCLLSLNEWLLVFSPLEPDEISFRTISQLFSDFLLTDVFAELACLSNAPVIHIQHSGFLPSTLNKDNLPDWTVRHSSSARVCPSFQNVRM